MSKSDRQLKRVFSPAASAQKQFGSMSFSRLTQSQSMNAGGYSKTMNSSISQSSRSTMFSTTTHALNCSCSGHSSSPITFVCLLEQCDKESRVACSKCLRGHHADHVQQMVRISELINHSNSTLISGEAGLLNFPIHPQGQEIRGYLQNENASITNLYRDIETFFEDFNAKITEKLDSLKKSILLDVNAFYLRGNGRQHMGFLAQLKKLYAEAYDPTEMSNLLRAFLLREISSDTLHTTLSQILQGSATHAAEAKLFQYFDQNASAHGATPKENNSSQSYENISQKLVSIDMNLLNSIEQQVLHSINRVKSCLSIQNPVSQAILEPLPTKANRSLSSQTNGAVSWEKQFEDVLNFLIASTRQLNIERESFVFKKESYADRSTYVGFHYNGTRHLLGARYYADGNIYFGQWDKGTKQGKGVMNFRQGTVYEGEWVNDKKHGIDCVETYPNGSKYEGSFENGVKHGFGKFIDFNGKVFEGLYLQDQRNGIGRFTYKNGSFEQVYYVQGERVSEEKYEQYLQQGGYSTMSQLKNRQPDESSRSNQTTLSSAQKPS